MTPDSIVKHLDIIKHICTGYFSSFIDSLFNSFLLQAAKKGFSNGIIPAVAPAAHTRN